VLDVREDDKNRDLGRSAQPQAADGGGNDPARGPEWSAPKLEGRARAGSGAKWVAAAALAGIAALGLGVGLVLASGDGPEVTGAGDRDSVAPVEAGLSSDLERVEERSSTTGAIEPPPDANVASPIEVVAATATSELLPQTSSCTGSRSTYGATNAVDGDDATAWAPSSNDGVGEVLTVDLGRQMRVTEVGLIPGYAKRGPLKWAGCTDQDQFWLNRWVARVRWSFDDGTSFEQSFGWSPTMQSMSADAVSRTVRIEVLATELPSGERVDDDTLISSVSILGSPA
jgi:hypothetical protein